MLNKVIVNIVISFVLRQLAKFKTGLDWTKVQRDVDERVRAIVPGSWCDDDAVAFVNSILAGIQYALGDATKLQDIMTALSKEDWGTAYSVLKELILGAWSSGAVASTASAQADMMIA